MTSVYIISVKRVSKEGNSKDAIRSGSGTVERSEDGRYLGVGSS